MRREDFLAVLQAFTRRRPFHPFTLELVSGGRLEVNHPEALTLHERVFVCNSTRGMKSVLE